MNYCNLLAVENLHRCEILIEELTLEDTVSNYQNSASKAIGTELQFSIVVQLIDQ